MEWFVKVLNLLKMPIKIIAFVALLSGILLFLPNDYVETLKLQGFINLYGQYFGIAFLISFSYLIFLIIPNSYKMIKQKISNKRNETIFLAKIEQILNDLSYPEKCLLREFILQEKHVIEAPIDNPEVTSLLNKGVIKFASKRVRTFIYGTYAFIKINEKAKDFFTNETFGLPNRQPTPKDLEKVKNERPNFLTRLDSINSLLEGRW